MKRLVWTSPVRLLAMGALDKSPQNGPNFLTCKTSQFLETARHQNVSTDLDFAPTESEKMFLLC